MDRVWNGYGSGYGSGFYLGRFSRYGRKGRNQGISNLVVYILNKRNYHYNITKNIKTT
jgi:hypothetical protein